MLKIAIGLFIAAIVTGLLGFTGWAGTFTGLAVLAFYAFIVLAALTFLASLVTGVGHSPGGVFGLLMVAAIAGAGAYWWVDNDMTAAKLGQKVDRTAVNIKSEAGDAMKTASNETGRLFDDVGDRADAAADRVQNKDEEQADRR